MNEVTRRRVFHAVERQEAGAMYLQLAEAIAQTLEDWQDVLDALDAGVAGVLPVGAGDDGGGQ